MTDKTAAISPKARTLRWSRTMILIRRVHLYTGLFLFPWVMLYGATGAMFNHIGLFPEATIQPVSNSILSDSGIGEFPSPEKLAQQVTTALQEATGISEIKTIASHPAEYTNGLMFEVKSSGRQHVVEMEPDGHGARILTRPDAATNRPEADLPDIHHVALDNDPQSIARDSAAKILADMKVAGHNQPKAFGWTKLNFLASIDGQPTRVTYVLKDGHVDLDPYTGDSGMPLRQFLLRLHTTHGQSPHWNGRTLWSLLVDVMAIAMVTWALTGIVMWWQLKRTRFMGGLVIVLSIAAASWMYLNLGQFYATTRL